jgi:hypothetical protein
MNLDAFVSALGLVFALSRRLRVRRGWRSLFQRCGGSDGLWVGLSRGASGLGMGDAGHAGHKNEQSYQTSSVTDKAFEDTDLHTTSMCAPQTIAMALARANSGVLAATCANCAP